MTPNRREEILLMVCAGICAGLALAALGRLLWVFALQILEHREPGLGETVLLVIGFIAAAGVAFVLALASTLDEPTGNQ